MIELYCTLNQFGKIDNRAPQLRTSARDEWIEIHDHLEPDSVGRLQARLVAMSV